MLHQVGCFKEAQGNANSRHTTSFLRITTLYQHWITSCVYGINVKCYAYGFRPAKGVTKTILEER